MKFSRILPIALVLGLAPVSPAAAQFGGMPGMPGAPGGPANPGAPGMPGSPFGAPQQPPPACQELLSFRDDVRKHGEAIQAASKKKAPPDQLCKLFKAYLAAEGKMLKALEERSGTCGVPSEAITQVKAGHGQA